MLGVYSSKCQIASKSIKHASLFARFPVRLVSTAFQEHLREVNFVGGVRCKPISPSKCEVVPSVEPRSGKTVGELHLSGEDEVNRAVDSAKRGLELWKRTTDFEKSRVMQKAAALLRERKAEIVQLDAIDTGR